MNLSLCNKAKRTLFYVVSLPFYDYLSIFSMDRPVENMHVPELKKFLRDNDVSLKGLVVKAQLVEK